MLETLQALHVRREPGSQLQLSKTAFRLNLKHRFERVCEQAPTESMVSNPSPSPKRA